MFLFSSTILCYLVLVFLFHIKLCKPLNFCLKFGEQARTFVGINLHAQNLHSCAFRNVLNPVVPSIHLSSIELTAGPVTWKAAVLCEFCGRQNAEMISSP
jgi:hypothetical protein